MTNPTSTVLVERTFSGQKGFEPGLLASAAWAKKTETDWATESVDRSKTGGGSLLKITSFAVCLIFSFCNFNKQC